MTIKTWTLEFMPVSARKSMNKRNAILHSIQKWKGLTGSNLKKHNVTLWDNVLSSEGTHQTVEITADTCALCVKYLDVNLTERCQDCPLYSYLGKRCDAQFDRGYGDMPYIVFRKTGNPRPMIKALKETLKALDKGEI